MRRQGFPANTMTATGTEIRIFSLAERQYSRETIIPSALAMLNTITIIRPL
jgi:hypothetical protein